MLLLDFLYFLLGLIEVLFKLKVLKRKAKPATNPSIAELINSWKQKSNPANLAS